MLGHEDVDLFTFLPAPDVDGLQVLNRNNMKWIRLKAPPGSIIINTGDYMQRISNDIFPSTTHRVGNPSEPGMLDCPRTSFPMAIYLWEDEVLEVQSVLEGLAAERAAEQATPQDIELLEELLGEAETLVNNPTAFRDSSLAFHMAIAEAAHSQALMMQLRSIRYFIWPPNNKTPNPKVAENVLKSHRKLLDLIRNQDAAGAQEFMRDHIEHIRNQHRKLREGGRPEDAVCC